MKLLRRTMGIILCLLGVILTLLPGSTIIVIAGLMLISVDYPPARKWLNSMQRGMRKGAYKLDKFILRRRFK